MKGLCHVCFTSNVDVMTNDGITVCQNCLYKNKL